jgi:methylenetetrahydrofolate reductase (NADH)
VDTVRPRGLLERLFVLVGVAPPRSASAARFMRENLPGVVVPDSVIDRLEDARDPREEGVDLTVEIITAIRKIDGFAGVHVMGIGQEEPVRKVIERAGLLPRP